MNPKNVNMYHPIRIIMNPKKKNPLPISLEGLLKKRTVFFAPIKDTIPIKNEIYLNC